MTPHQKAWSDWLASFKQICLDFDGVAIDPLRFEIQTDLGKLTASVHESDYESQKKRHYISIYLRFETYDTGKVYDTLFGRTFNGWSSKWNIGISGGGDLASNRLNALNELALRLLQVTENKRAQSVTVE